MKNLMKEINVFKVDRRSFLKTSSIGATGLLLGVQFGCESKKLSGDPNANFSPNVYLNINGTGEVSIIAHRSEMGTGIRTSLPLIVADELEADWSKVKIVQAVADAKYGNQNTDGSFSVRMFYTPLRRAGAAARMLLEQAAANEWQVDVSECKAQNHEVLHSSGKAFGFGYLAEKAALLEVPAEDAIQLKSTADFKYITKKSSIYDLEDIVTGKAVFGLDIKIDGAKIAVVQRPPVAGGSVKSFNGDAAAAVAGVTNVVKLESTPFPAGFASPLGGVAVIADNTWSALKGRETLTIEWDNGPHGDYSTAEYEAEMMANANKKGNVRREQGEVATALSSSAKVITADYRVPHLSHAPMETPCAVANFKDGKVDVWAPVQDPQTTRTAVAAATGLDEENVTINITLLGGAFGRKSKPDFVVEAVLLSRENGTPIKLLWTREDDLRHDYYHSNCAQHMEVALDDNNNISGWLHRSVLPSLFGTDSPAKEASGLEISMGMIDLPYNTGSICCETQEAPTKIRVGWLRSVANINHTFAVGCTLDEVADSRGVDPAQNLLDLLGEDRQIDFPSLAAEFWNYNEEVADYPWDTGRFRNVIEQVRDQSKWGKSMSVGGGMGIAAHRSFLTYVACVVEVEVTDGKIKIPNVYYTIDCGVPVNPDRIKSQFEGGAAFASSLALKSEITVKNGVVQQSNFDDYLVARITDAPYNTEVQIIDSNEKPTGVGEPPVPPFIPALCNAIYEATGQRIRKLPIEIV